MLSFNFYTKNGTKDVHIENPVLQFTFSKGDEINFKDTTFFVHSVEYNVTENSIEQIVRCELNV